jgi:hypothetical protein
MIRPFYLILAASSSLALAATPTLSAAQSSAHFNIAAGATIPTGDLSNFTDVGYNITGGIGMTPRGSQLSFRAEGFFNELGITDTDSKFRIAGVTANATYDFTPPSTTAGFVPYVIGGLGYYNTHDTGFDESDSNLGFNVGAGFKFPLSGFSAYVEARYHTVSNSNTESAHFIPIVFGLVF